MRDVGITLSFCIAQTGTFAGLHRSRGALMNKALTVLAMMGFAVGVVVAGSASAQSQPERTIEQFSCKDLMRDGGPNREVAIAFLHGYFLGKSGAAKFNLDVLEKQTDAFIERCLDNPNEKAVEAMSSIKK
jgi:HdeA/HdeB family protein